MDNVNNQILKVDSSLFESMPSYKCIEGVRIHDEWINHKDYPVPPSEKEQPTEESKMIYDKYREALLIFSDERLKEWKAQ